MKLIISNNHYLVNLKTNNQESLFIIDTGSPISFTLDKDIKNVIINDKKYDLKKCPNEEIRHITNNLTKDDVKGFIGMDILKDTGLTLDFMNTEVEFKSKEDGHILAFLNSSIQGYKTTKDLVINHNILNNTFIDTGACISYVSSKYLNKEDKTNERYHDINPLIGEIDGYFYNARLDKVTLGSGDYGHNIKVGKLPTILENLGFDAIVNPKILILNESKLMSDETISINYVNKEIHII